MTSAIKVIPFLLCFGAGCVSGARNQDGHAGEGSSPQGASLSAEPSSKDGPSSTTTLLPSTSSPGPGGTSASQEGPSSGGGASPAAFAILGLGGLRDSTVDASFTGDGFPQVTWTPSSGQSVYEVTLWDRESQAIRCPIALAPAAAQTYTYTHCRGALRPLTQYVIQLVARDDQGNSTQATNSPYTFTYNPEAWPPHCSISGGQPGVANGVDACVVSVVLKNSDGVGLEGITPSFAASNTRGTNRYACAPTNPQGEALCQLWSSVAELKMLRLLTPVVLDGPSVRFDPGAAVQTAFLLGTPDVARVRVCSSPFFLGLADATGNLTNSSVALTLAVSSDIPAAVHIHTDADCGTAPVTTLTVPAHGTGVTFYVSAGAAGPFSLRAGEPLTPSTQRVTAVTPAPWVPMTTLGAPEPRSDPVLAWTGQELLVWGGHDFGSLYANGARYNPFLDAWTAMSDVGAPVEFPRAGVWSSTTQELLVWGGGNDYTCDYATSDGARYHPGTDSWRPISRVGAPSARAQHSLVWTGKEMVVWGGCVTTGGGSFAGDGGRYNPTTDTWTPVSLVGAPQVLGNHAAVWTGTHMLTWGGWDPWGYNPWSSNAREGGMYDPNQDSWQALATEGQPPVLGFPSAVWTGNEMVVFGGLTEGGWSSNIVAHYNPTRAAWTVPTVTGPPAARGHHVAVWTGAHMLILGGAGALGLGGWEGGTAPTGGGAGYSYTPATHSWSTIPTVGGPAQDQWYQAGLWNGAHFFVWGGKWTRGPLNSGFVLVPPE